MINLRRKMALIQVKARSMMKRTNKLSGRERMKRKEIVKYSEYINKFFTVMLILYSKYYNS